jgi:N-acetylglucosaminyldiphosphoundecaprenol N-acetyl-beta-D-mannosaminyltransferase
VVERDKTLKDFGKKNVLGIKVDAVDYEAAVNKILAAAQTHETMSISALAVHGIMTGVLDSTHRYRLNHFDLILPDGQPVRWALNLLYHIRLPDRVYGPTLMLRVCEKAAMNGQPVYFYGSRPAVLEALTSNLQACFQELLIAGSQPSRFRQLSKDEEEKIASEIQRSGAAISFVGLGCPKQEVWVYEHRALLSMPMIAVGAAFDFHAGMLAQAPAALQRKGLEWAYRLSREPMRLWKRYALLNPLYLLLLLIQLTGLAKFDSISTSRPTKELRYG